MATQSPRVFATLLVRRLPLPAALFAVGCISGEPVPGEHRNAVGAEEWVESESGGSAEESQGPEIHGESSDGAGAAETVSSAGADETVGVQETVESKEESPFVCQPEQCPPCRLDRQQPCCNDDGECGCGLLFVMCL